MSLTRTSAVALMLDVGWVKHFARPNIHGWPLHLVGTNRECWVAQKLDPTYVQLEPTWLDAGGRR
jgi:hypothetical protein